MPTQTIDPAKIFAIDEGERKTFHDTDKLKEVLSTKCTLQRMLKAIPQIEDRNNHSQETVQEK